MTTAAAAGVPEQIRPWLLALLTLGILGTAADLLLLDHYEEIWQFLPLILLALALANVAWIFFGGGVPALVAMRVVMVAFIAAGALGVLLHYNGNSEFQHEIDPTLGGWPLFAKVMRAKAPPALAPGSMIQLGLLGLLYTYHHPVLRIRLTGSPVERS